MKTQYLLRAGLPETTPSYDAAILLATAGAMAICATKLYNFAGVRLAGLG
jgi:hypothetical protein